MKTLLAFALALLAAAPAVPQQIKLADSDVIEGRVTRPGGTEGVAEAQVVLRARSEAGDGEILQSLYTEADGRFTFKKVPPGVYEITAERDGYFGAPSAGMSGMDAPGSVSATVTVIAGFTAPAVSLTLARGGVISGRVRDPKGRLVAGFPILIYQITYGEDGRGLLSPVKGGQTDDRGEYRMFWMPPGSYLVAATPMVAPSPVPTPQDVYARTFHPGLIDPRIVPPVVVTDGAEVPSIDILIRPEAVAKISGRVVSPFPDADVPPKDSQNLFLITQNPDALAETLRPFVQNEAANRANGRFELRNVLPGSYDLVARVQDISGRVAWGRTRVNVGSADIDGVTVETRLGHAIKARLSIDGDPGPSPGAAPPDAEGNGPAVEPQPGAASAGDPVKKDVKPDIMLQLQSSEPYSLHAVGAAGQTTFDPASNVYTFPNVPEGRYRFHVDPLPPNSYVEDVREGSVSVFDEGLSVAGGPPGDVVVLVNSRGATISGVVTAADQKTFEGAQVALVPAAFARRSNLLLYKSARTGERGEFEMHGVAPGEYRLFAWENVPDNAWLNADFMALQEARGKSVKVPAAGTATADLKLIPKEIR